VTASPSIPAPTFAQLWRRPTLLLAFGFGAGLSPKAPGTAGSLVALPLYVLLVPLSLTAYAALLAVLFLAGVWITAQAEAAIATHDHPGIVWDEIVGQLVALTLAPASLVSLLLGFALFRLFDIWKPFPIRWLNNHVQGGWGIMLDDLAAGIAAALCLHGILKLWTPN
jgi:phosphatidylglycerophosphatase A